jgi:hypothetical protein
LKGADIRPSASAIGLSEDVPPYSRQIRVNHLIQSILAKAFRGEHTAEWRAANPELISGEFWLFVVAKRRK